MHSLKIQHVEGSDPAQFQIWRPDGKSVAPAMGSTLDTFFADAWRWGQLLTLFLPTRGTAFHIARPCVRDEMPEHDVKCTPTPQIT